MATIDDLAWRLACPACGADEGEPCYALTSHRPPRRVEPQREAMRTHPARKALARERHGEELDTGPALRHPEDRRERIARAYADGASVPDLARAHGVSVRTIWRYIAERSPDRERAANKNGWRRVRRPRLSEERRARILELASEGVSHAEIARRVGCGSTTVDRLVRESR